MSSKRFVVYLPTELWEEFRRLFPNYGSGQEIVRRIIRQMIFTVKERIKNKTEHLSNQETVKKIVKEEIDSFLP